MTMKFAFIPKKALIGTDAEGVDMWACQAGGFNWIVTREGDTFLASFKLLSAMDKPATFVGRFEDFDAAIKACEVSLEAKVR